MLTVLLIVLLLLAFGLLPVFPYNHLGGGYYPSGVLVLILLICLIWALFSGYRWP
jgi:hypothetical protein